MKSWEHVQATGNRRAYLAWREGTRYTVRNAESGEVLNKGTSAAVVWGEEELLIGEVRLTQTVTKALLNGNFTVAGVGPFGTKVLVDIEGSPVKTWGW